MSLVLSFSSGARLRAMAVRPKALISRLQRPVSRVASFGVRVAILAVGHLAMVAVMFVLLETYEPDPNGFRFDSFAKIASFVVLALGPVVIGLFAKRLGAVGLIAVLQAASPLVLLPQLQSGEGDLNFVLLLWWFPLPVVAALILAFEQFSISRRNKRLHAAENLVLPPPDGSLR